MNKPVIVTVMASVCVIAITCWNPSRPEVSTGTLNAKALALPDAAFCQAYSGLPDGWGKDAMAGMVYVKGGIVELGTTKGYPDERPAAPQRIAAFWIDRTEVTNAQFAAFVQSTGYVTDAERAGGATVFIAPSGTTASTAEGEWWHYTKGANWRHPEGPDSRIDGRKNHPVVQVTQADALAYARWLGRDLPSEAEWEFAAKANGNGEQLDRAPRNKEGRPLANFWQGLFPYMNTTEDGFVDRAPAGCFPPNGFGIVDMIGNVWEWTRDRYAGSRQPHGNGDPFPVAQAAGKAPSANVRMVIKGGSYLCSADYCVRYRAAARYPNESGMATSHVGFRTVSRETGRH